MMSEPNKIPDHIPESYRPKKPEIINMAEGLNNEKEIERKQEMVIEPLIIHKAFFLVGAERAVDLGLNFEPELVELRSIVNDRLKLITGLVKPARMVGFWHLCELPSGKNEYRYFAGVEADCINPPDGLISKTLPKSLYAVFNEQKRGQMGGPDGYAYKWLRASSYEENNAIKGDFEIFKNMIDTSSECEAEIYIPIKQRAKIKKEQKVMIEPFIMRRAFSLIGVEKPIISGQDFESVLTEMRRFVINNLNRIPGLLEPPGMIGFTHVCKSPSGKNEYRHFAGVEANCKNPPDGFISKNLPESLYAVFCEQKRGQMGGAGGYAYKWLRASEVYKGSQEIKGDFIIYKNMTDVNPECEAEILIPIEEK